ncbi:MAG TPA: S9 family peptidase [Candidatus Polarisedimenticolaceae bacterium]
MRILLLAALFSGFATLAAIAAPPGQIRGLNVRDLVAFDRISEPVPSPDGRTVVFTVSALDLDANRRRADLWRVGIDGSGLRRLTAHTASDTAPAWSPDGKWIYFQSSRSGSSQVWKLPIDGGEAQPVTTLPLDVNAFKLSPDGASLAVALDVFLDAPAPADTKKRLDEKAAVKATGRLYDRLLFRHWDTWSDGRRQHWYVLPSTGKGDPVAILKGLDGNAPTKPFGGSEEAAFTPDGKGLVFTARVEGAGEAWSTNLDLWLVPIDGSAPPKRLTEANRAVDTQPVFSPDGKTLAWLAMVRPGYEADRQRIMLMDWPGGTARALTETWDRSPENLAWSKDGKTIYCTAHNLGRAALFAVDAKTGTPKAIVDEGTSRYPSIAGEVILFGRDHQRAPVDLYTVKPDGSQRTRITKLNDERLAAVAMGEPEPFTFKGWNDETVHAWVVKPANFEAGKKYPVAFLIHGGPQGSFGDDFHYRWNPQTYAGAGYAAVMVDFHGSTGYGQAFTDAIRGDWGGKPLEDLKKGLDAALKKYPWMDGDRVAALGASYGGYMVNWIAGNWPDRFRCLVTHDGNLDERFAYFDTEELWFPEWEHHGTPWENPEAYTKHNPIDHVAKWKTPMLVIHGGLDFRVVETHGMSTFTALQRKGIPSKFLHFPDENHWVLKPHNSILWHDTVLGWLDEWTKAPQK